MAGYSGMADRMLSERPAGCVGMRRLGEIGKGSGRGVLLHAMLGVDAETGGILGLATGRVWTRDSRVTVPHRNRPLSEKESQRWLSTAEAAKTVLRQAIW